MVGLGHGRCGACCGLAPVADDSGDWANIVRWIVANPEKLALALVLVTGAWRWIREAIHDAKGTTREETLVDTLLKERNALAEENKGLRAEIRDMQKSGNGEIK